MTLLRYRNPFGSQTEYTQLTVTRDLRFSPSTLPTTTSAHASLSTNVSPYPIGRGTFLDQTLHTSNCKCQTAYHSRSSMSTLHQYRPTLTDHDSLLYFSRPFYLRRSPLSSSRRHTPCVGSPSNRHTPIPFHKQPVG